MTTPRVFSIYAEMTPNPMAMKFVGDRLLLPDGVQFEFMTREAATSSPMALKLFDLPFVKGVYIAANFITILKNDKAMWDDVVFDVRDYIKEFILSGGQIWDRNAVNKDGGSQDTKEPSIQNQLVVHAEAANETEQKIIDAIETYVKPAVENDGGLILFQSFKDGIVTLQLKGSCSGCPSSSNTLKSAVEQLLKRMVPEVKEVTQEMA